MCIIQHHLHFFSFFLLGPHSFLGFFPPILSMDFTENLTIIWRNGSWYQCLQITGILALYNYLIYMLIHSVCTWWLFWLWLHVKFLYLQDLVAFLKWTFIFYTPKTPKAGLIPADSRTSRQTGCHLHCLGAYRAKSKL